MGLGVTDTCAPVSVHHVSSRPCILSLKLHSLIGWNGLRVEASFCCRCLETSWCGSPSNKWEKKVWLSFENPVYPVIYMLSGAVPHMIRGGGGGDDAPYYCSSYTLLLPLNSFSFQGILVATISEVRISCWERSPPRILLFPRCI